MLPECLIDILLAVPAVGHDIFFLANPGIWGRIYVKFTTYFSIPRPQIAVNGHEMMINFNNDS